MSKTHLQEREIKQQGPFTVGAINGLECILNNMGEHFYVPLSTICVQLNSQHHSGIGEEEMHTPFPWTIHYMSDFTVEIRNDQTDFLICTINIPSIDGSIDDPRATKEHGPHMANADLIESIPEMVKKIDVIEKLVKALKTFMRAIPEEGELDRQKFETSYDLGAKVLALIDEEKPQ